jgi:predicted RNA polymerase sigma factor
VVEVAAARLGDHHRVAAVRGHLLELAGRRDEAVAQLRRAAALATSTPERDHLSLRAAALARAAPPLDM